METGEFSCYSEFHATSNLQTDFFYSTAYTIICTGRQGDMLLLKKKGYRRVVKQIRIPPCLNNEKHVCRIFERRCWIFFCCRDQMFANSTKCTGDFFLMSGGHNFHQFDMPRAFLGCMNKSVFYKKKKKDKQILSWLKPQNLTSSLKPITGTMDT